METRRRLRDLAESDEAEASLTRSDEVDALASAAAAAEAAHAEAIQSLRLAEAEWREYDIRVSERRRRLEELGLESVPAAESVAAVERLVAMIESLIVHLKAQEDTGERLGVTLAQVAQQSRRDEMQREVDALAARVSRSQADVRAREATGELAGHLIESLREAGSLIVREQLNKIEPVLQRIYARTDPHPTFRVVRFLTRMSHGRGHLRTPIEDRAFGVLSEAPEVILSSSQMNALAVGIFLAFNIALPTIPLKIAILDDPLQSLDDINLLGLIDLLRRAKERRQLLLSTHDERFRRLLERKLRPVASTQRTVVIELSEWSREGPTVRHREVRRDPQLLHLAVS
jgi:hypothetical protein